MLIPISFIHSSGVELFNADGVKIGNNAASFQTGATTGKVLVDVVAVDGVITSA